MANRKNRSSRRNRKSRSSRRNRRQNGGAYNPGTLSLNQGREFQEAHKLQHGGGNLNWAPVVAGDQGMLPADMREQARVVETFDAVNQASSMRDPDQLPVQAGGRRRGSRSRRSRRNNNGSMMRRSRRRRNNNGSVANMTPSMRRSRRRRSSRRNNNGSVANMTPSMRRRRSSRRNNNGGMNMTPMNAQLRRRRRKQHGGLRVLEGASYDSPNMLLSPSEAAKAGTADFRLL